MKISNKRLAAMLLALLTSPFLWGHPHLQKTVTAVLPGGAEVSVSFFTNPANEKRANNKAVGSFSIGAQLKLTSDVTVGTVKLAAGDYLVGALKKGEGEWTMAVAPGKMQPGAKFEVDLTELNSSFSTSQGNSPHSQWDITPGQGEQEGQVLLIWRFANMTLAVPLS